MDLEPPHRHEDWGRSPPEPPRPESRWTPLKKLFWPILVVLGLLLKFGAKLKFLVVPLLKFFPVILKTGGTMALTIWAYTMYWGFGFALGFVLLILAHECGHLLAARRVGLKVGAPVFIPFMGAFIALKEAPKNAWIESQVGVGGPFLGTLAAGVCFAIYTVTGQPFFSALAYTGFLLNLFNLAPIGFLDGGRIVTALSPWLWVLGLGVMLALLIHHMSFIILLLLVLSLPRVFSLFRKKSTEERRYFEVSREQRWSMAALYFGLIAVTTFGMQLSHITPPGA